MNLYAGVAQRIRRELTDIERAVNSALRSWRHAKILPAYQDAFLESVALNLHGFYTGIERICVQIARRIDQNVPTGSEWHITLLNQMTMEIPGVRPAVLSEQTCQNLDEFRRFRHLVRNVYTHNLIPEKLEALIDLTPQTWSSVEVEFNNFANLLDQLAEAAERES